MGYSVHRVLVDTFDYSAVTWDELRDMIIGHVSSELHDKIEHKDYVEVAKAINFNDLDTIEYVLEDLNDAAGVVILGNPKYEDCIYALMEVANL